MIPQKRPFCFALMFALLLPHLGTALAQAPFYKGKTITIIQSRAPGGTETATYDRSRLFSRVCPRQSAIVIEYMPGAGGRTQANHMYASPNRTA